MKEISLFLLPLLVTKSKLLTEKQMHKLKVSSYILLGTLLETKTWDTAFQRVLRNFHREIRKDSRYLGIFTEKKKKNQKLYWNTSRLLLTIIKKQKAKTKQASQVNDVNAFLHMARCKSLSSLKLFI